MQTDLGREQQLKLHPGRKAGPPWDN